MNIILNLPTGSSNGTPPLILPNLLTKTDQFDDAIWTKGASSISANSTAHPVGGAMTADGLIEDSSNAYHFTSYRLILPAEPHTVSIYAKSLGRDFVALQEGYSGIGIFFNLSTGATGAAFGPAPSDAGSVNMGGGWWRLWIVATPPGADAALNLYMFPDETIAAYEGDGTSGVILAGAMINVGSALAQYAAVA